MIPPGATVQAWFSELSAGQVARVAANQFMPNQNFCKTLSSLDKATRKKYKLPKKCPVKAGRKFVLDQTLDSSFWNGVEEYKHHVVGASGILELRLLDKPPCTLCWKKPIVLVGVSIPFEVLDEKKKKNKKNKNKRGSDAGTKKRGSKRKREDL